MCRQSEIFVLGTYFDRYIKMKVLELFSGIGGMHFACEEASKSLQVVAAVEINPIANEVYRFNFPSTKLLQKNIQSLTSNEINELSPDIILMSPPCQPFTRNGLKKDLDDLRTNPLQHIISILPHLETVQYLLVENVKGFETSEARNLLVNCLRKLDFKLQEFILSPHQFGVLNTRHRYYLLARKSNFSFETCDELMCCLPKEIDVDAIRTRNITGDKIGNIVEYLDETSDVYKSHLIPVETLVKRIFVLDIITKDCDGSCCFTKAYSQYFEGTGSVFSNASLNTVKDVLEKCKNCSSENLDRNLIESLNLRFFTPVEISKLMSFPTLRFKFPNSVTKKQQYRLLGNSINVLVVSKLVSLLLEK